jgi:Predicted methyltransferase (contains TPR repeat)
LRHGAGWYPVQAGCTQTDRYRPVRQNDRKSPTKRRLWWTVWSRIKQFSSAIKPKLWSHFVNWCICLCRRPWHRVH